MVVVLGIRIGFRNGGMIAVMFGLKAIPKIEE